MNNDLFNSTVKLQLTDAIEKNFPINEKYFHYRYRVFFELEHLVFEIAKCRILQLNYAVVTATNHLLERLLKLSLIHNAAGIGPKSLNQMGVIYAEPSQKYGSINLGKSIEQCRIENLIDDEEKTILYDYIRNTIRNGFSHADPGKILSGMPDEQEYYQANAETNEWNTTSFNPKAIPQIQAHHIESFANETAIFYFDFIFELLVKIESRLLQKNV